MSYRSFLYASFAVACLVAFAPFGRLHAADMTVPPVPTEIRVPAGHVLFMQGHAVGTQNYVCKPGTTGAFAWTLFGPQATLFYNLKWIDGDYPQQIMTHFLSLNPDEGGLARPTWQSSLDSSAVWGKMAGTTSDPAYVAPGAVAWLLLEIVGAEPGPKGGVLMKPTKYIQRLNTAGGVAPSTGCSAATPGATVLVPYETDYFFYRAAR